MPVVDTRQGKSATSNDALQLLGNVVSEHMPTKKRSGEKINIDNLRSVARLHHLNDDWLNGVQVREISRWKILKDGEQIAMWAQKEVVFQ